MQCAHKIGRNTIDLCKWEDPVYVTMTGRLCGDAGVVGSKYDIDLLFVQISLFFYTDFQKQLDTAMRKKGDFVVN